MNSKQNMEEEVETLRLQLRQALSHCSQVHPTATHCNTLQHTAINCNTRQHTATHCNTPWKHSATAPASPVALVAGSYVYVHVYSCIFIYMYTYMKYGIYNIYPPAPMNHVKYLRAGPAEMSFQNWYTANTNHFQLTDSVRWKSTRQLG